jgi:hypothetical protein
MAFLAQERRTRFQQWRNVGTVRRMAVGAVFRNWLVFKQQGAAFFGVTDETSLGHC